MAGVVGISYRSEEGQLATRRVEYEGDAPSERRGSSQWEWGQARQWSW